MPFLTKVTLVHLGLPGIQPAAAPLGVLYLAAYLRANGIPVEVRDYQLVRTDDPLRPEELCAFLERCGELLAISCMSSAIPLLLGTVGAIAEAYPDRRIVVGGYGPSGDAARILADFPSIDYVISGWGEQPLFTLVRAIDREGALESVPGLTYRHGSEVRATTTPPAYGEVNALPWPAYDLIDLADYRQPPSVITARGCPFRCTFCDIPGFLQGRSVLRRLPDVIEEIRAVAARCRSEFPRPRISIVDDTFSASRSRVVEFCQLVHEAGLDVEWSAACRVDQVDEPLLECMADAGCRGVFFGVESGADPILGTIGKQTTAAQAERAIRLALDRIGAVDASFIWGLPDETSADFGQSLMLMAVCRDLGANVKAQLWSPLPNSRLFFEHQHRLVYSRTFQSDMAGVRPLPGPLEELVLRYPRLCAPFYHFPHPDLEKRRELLFGTRTANRVLG